MPRRVDEVEKILLPVVRGVRNGDRLAFYRYAALALDVHVVGHLSVIEAGIYYFCFFDEAVGER